MITRRSSSLASTPQQRPHAGNGAKVKILKQDRLVLSAKAPVSTLVKTTNKRDDRPIVTSDEEEGEPGSTTGRSKVRKEHEHFGKCLILAIEKKISFCCRVFTNYPEMNAVLAKYTADLLQIRGILWAYARKGDDPLGYCNSDGFVRGMDVRAYYNKISRKEKAIIRYAKISGKDANEQLELCAARLAEENREQHFSYCTLASDAEIQSAGYDDVIRFFVRKKPFTKEEKKRCAEAGSSAGIQTIKQNYLKGVATAAYTRIYFEHDTGSDTDEQGPILHEKESRALVDALKVREVSTKPAETPKTAAFAENDWAVPSSQPPKKVTRVPASNASAKTSVVMGHDMVDKMPGVSANGKPVPTKTCSMDKNVDKSAKSSPKDDSGSTLHTPPLSSSLEDIGDDDDIENDEDDGLGHEEREGTKTKSVTCELDATPELHGEDWEMYGAPYHVPTSAPLERCTKPEIAAKLRFYRDKKNIYAEKYSEFKALVEITVPKTAKQKPKKVEPADIDFTFLEKNIIRHPQEKHYAPLTAKRRFFIDREVYHKIMKGTHKYSTNPETVYRGLFWHELMSFPNKVKLATQKKEGQGFAGLFKDLYKDLWSFIKSVSEERTRAGALPGSVWHIDNFPKKEVRNEIYRKEQTGFASRITRYKGINKKVELQKLRGGGATMDVDEEEMD